MSNQTHFITVGVTGGIAAYKSAELVSMLVRSGHTVQVVMTANAQKFITPLTFFTLSRRPVVTNLFDLPSWQPEHVALAQVSDLLVVAPATANFIGKLAGGVADDALSTLAITTKKPIMIAPAMNPDMWSNPTVQENVAMLQSRGVQFIGPESGRVACGEPGAGRMSEPETIRTAIEKFFA